MTPLTPSEVGNLLQSVAPDGTVCLVGAGGAGMGALGHLFLDLGFRVVGSDLVENEATRQLQGRGADIQKGHSAERVRLARPFLVVYSAAVQPKTPEIVAAHQLQIPVARRGTVLAALLRRRRGICVAGMHGKTTTSALAAFVLDQLGAQPSYAIGAQVPQLSPHARFAPKPDQNAAGPGPYFVAETDESDGTLGDFEPEHAVLLNLDEEHLDHFSSLEDICREFRQFAAQVSGKVIHCADDPHLAKLLAGWPNAVSYGFRPDAEYRLECVPAEAAGSRARVLRRTRFKLWHRGELLGEFATSLMGRQNASNAAAVIALLHGLGFGPSDIARAFRAFRGADRRLQELYRDERYRLFDDYGHHPTEIRATLCALRELAPRRLLVVFQPHRFTRTQSLLAGFSRCFDDADALWLVDIYPAHEPPIAGVSSAVLAEAIRDHGQKVSYTPTLGDLCADVRGNLEPGDLVLFLGAGDITEAAHRFALQLQMESSERRESLRVELSERLSPASVVRPDEPLAKRTTLRVGGQADLYVEPASEADLAEVLHFCAGQRLPFLVLGRGSNLLIPDNGVRGLVLSLTHPEFCRVEVRGEKILCGAGAKLKALAVEAKRHGLGGLEFLEGIPGSVGGALRMNAGAMGGAMFEFVESVRFMDFSGQVLERRADEIEVHYRGCPLFRNHIALGAVLKGHPEDRELIAEKMKACSQRRWRSQPAAPSAGCIFKNPESIPAGRLIEELGLKGMRVGGAVVSELHGNFIINEGGATAADVLELIDLVQQRAQSARGIELHPEIEIVGEVAPCRADEPEQDCHFKRKLTEACPS
ncbi:MAG: UDP-N-acetylmuramate--L-alanine ligase [Verrucomicrobia bacterium]|nr:UDP-N-acetylmuramate--L-alanine ligase [Verrucomicrobiota bacterium]